MRPLRVFLCHASQDKPAVWRLHRYFTQHGVKPWLDQADLLPGEDWEVEIPNAIYSSDVILVCLSKNSVNKEGMVQKEISFALDKALEKPGKIFIIPVKLEECDVPNRLSRFQWVGLFRDGGRKRLLMSLNKRVTELGGEVSPVIMEDSRQRTPRPPSPKPEVKIPEEQIISAPVKEEIKEEPITEILAPIPPSPSAANGRGQGSALSGEAISKRESKRWFAFGGIALIFLLFVVFGGDYFLNNLPETETPTATPSITSKPPISTATKIPVTATFTSLPPTPTLEVGSTMVSEKDGMVLVYVPAGEFTMGSNFGEDNQKPEHQVVLDAFWADQTEVTNAMYAKCVAANQCDPASDTKSYTHPNYYGNSEFDEYPVINVSWNDAIAYCSWAERRLPTEAEWEKAARGTNGNTYPWGNKLPYVNLLNYNRNVGDTTEVGKYPDGASIYGALDMAGNVWEWVNDWYSETYYQSSPSSNPLGPDSGTYRVYRGGSWYAPYYYYVISGVRSANRGWWYRDPSFTPYDLGFRCARSP